MLTLTREQIMQNRTELMPDFTIIKPVNIEVVKEQDAESIEKILAEIRNYTPKTKEEIANEILALQEKTTVTDEKTLIQKEISEILNSGEPNKMRALENKIKQLKPYQISSAQNEAEKILN